MNCLMKAWGEHEPELRGWLYSRLGNPHDADDMLQDLFLKALRQDKKFCEITNARAWLFEVVRNALADRLRLRKNQVELPADLVQQTSDLAPVESLSACLPRVLMALSEQDRDAITHCDLNGMSQEDYAGVMGLTLPAAKSRVQRARTRLRAQLMTACQVKLDEVGKVCCFVPHRPPP